MGKGTAEAFLGPEKDILLNVIQTIREWDWNILLTHYGSFFDIDYLIKRCALNGLKFDIGRRNDVPRILVKAGSGKARREEHLVRMTGRIHVDKWKEAIMDQSLYAKVKGHSLKELARWFHLEPIEIPRGKFAALTEKELEEYVLSDARCTYGLAEIYLGGLFGLAETLELPFNLVAERSPSHPSNYFYMREMARRNVVSDANNQTRYRNWFVGDRAHEGALLLVLGYKEVLKAFG